ncbi:hypothetical protein FLA105534_01456 [Flavobacterium bizetiae]|uniref:Uncharacterized protein n=1 Tax=Flavobacterium bizetiae TaxID=2704140 RepID=A0A6J4GCY8_9FLAO|nr:DUF6766 family protein [Flavobacterium bizetiae]CAA9197069.1 hypothetical protein FLA105534_01456 [Flavobacterium bizetiae]CAD5341536.1 hypothetical protein FLA105535_01510 [Flavobacterium bizetiae]CAD5348003.1 hypothetical protein FLA105534_01962 [Flavobacterium bizetiae]
MKKFFYHNSLSIVFLLLFIGAFTGQIFFGIEEYNKELIENGGHAVTMSNYLTTGHFIEATFENWESEFLQMGLLVWLTIFLKQKGSSESKGFDGDEKVDREPSANRKGAPWPVKKGGVWLWLYQNSLTISLFLLFFASLILHFYGSLKDENETNILKGNPPLSLMDYLGDSRFWFESFQNWQSEFLSVFAIIVLSIFLRQKGSSQSKPVDASHSETGD